MRREHKSMAWSLNGVSRLTVISASMDLSQIIVHASHRTARVILASPVHRPSICVAIFSPMRRNGPARRSEEHTSELQSLMRISYAVFCLKKKRHQPQTHTAIHNYIITKKLKEH